MSTFPESNNLHQERVKANNGTFDEKPIADARRPSIIGEKSPGVARIEAVSAQLTTLNRVFLFLGVFLIAFVYSLDGVARYAYQPYATASYGQHSLLTTVGVLRGVIAAAAQPTAAKIADVFGRIELVLVSIVFYVIGSAVEAASNNVETFVAGAVIYQIGYTCIILLVEVIIGDTTSLRSRLFFSYIPATPFLIITWVSGNVTAAVLTTTSWRWGIGMWCIIYPVCAMPLVITLWLAGHKAKRNGSLDSYKTPFQQLGFAKLCIQLFWVLDVIGLLLIICILGLILTPLTIAGGVVSQWSTAKIIAPLVIGILCIPVFIFWEMKAQYPLVPFTLLKDRGVWAALGIALFLNFAWYMQGAYLFSVLQIAFNFSIAAATRISGLYSFTSVLTGFVLGLIVYKVKQLKWFIVAGTTLFLVAFGLLIEYRGMPTKAGRSGIIGAEVLLGFAGGLFPYPTQASIQAATKHEHMAVITGLYLAVYQIGSALGNCVSGAIWSQTLPGALERNMADLGNSTLAATTYGNPFAVILEYPFDSPERDAIIQSYQESQRVLCIVGICLCIPLIVFSLLLRNPKLGKEQSLPDAEVKVIH